MIYRAPVDDILFNISAVAPGPHSPEIPAETREEWRAILDQAAVLVEETIAPLNRAGDLSGSAFENGVVRTPAGWREAYTTWAEAGWNGVSLPVSHGGAGLPIVIGTATMEMLTSACMALSTLPVLAQCAVPALEVHADPAIAELYLPKLISGAWTATMNLTEPQAGSDLDLLKSRAEPAGDGTYRLFGQKTFITFGEHDLAENIIHLVLARLPGAPPGTKGISLFVAPKFLVHSDGRLGSAQRSALRRDRAQARHQGEPDLHDDLRRRRGRGRLARRRAASRASLHVHHDEPARGSRPACKAWRSASAPISRRSPMPRNAARAAPPAMRDRRPSSRIRTCAA